MKLWGGVLGLLVFFLLAGTVQATWADNTFESKVRVDTNYNNTATTIVPFLLNGTSGINLTPYINNGTLNDDCSDLRIYNLTEDTLIPFEIANNTCGDNTELWVAPNMDDQNWSFYFYFNNSGASSASNRSIWDNGSSLVYHMGGSIFENNSQGSANQITDLVDTANNVTFAETDSQHFGSARVYDGDSGQGLVSSAPVDYIQADNLTIEAWVNFTGYSLAGEHYIFGYGRAAAEDIKLSVDSIGRVQCLIRTSAGATTINSGGDNILTRDEFFHIVCGNNGTHHNMFINGSKVSSSANAGTFGENANNISVGSNRNSLNPVNGSVDDLQIWNRTLTDAEVLERSNYRLIDRAMMDADSVEQVQIPEQVVFILPSPVNGSVLSNNKSIVLKVGFNITSLGSDVCTFHWYNETNPAGLNYTDFSPTNTSCQLALGHQNNGDANFTVYINNTEGVSNNTVNLFIHINFAAGTVCTEGEVACGGRDATYILVCDDDDGDGDFGWSNFNRTYCAGGCSSGICKNTDAVCQNQCDVDLNQLTCGGDNNKFSFNCTTDANGCSVWNNANKTFCEFGCREGRCLQNTDKCFPGSQQCFGNYILNCVDTDGDGFSEFDLTNTTLCTNECNTIITNGLQQAVCEFGSGNLTTIFNLQQSIENVADEASFVFPDIAWRAGFVIMIAMIFWGLLAAKTTWHVGTIASIAIVGAGMFGGWVPIYVGIIYVLFGGMILFMGVRNGS